MRNPLSLIRVDVAIARLAAVIGVAFFAQSIPLQLEQLPNMHPMWNLVTLGVLIASLAACCLAAIVRRVVRETYIVFAIAYLVALLTWPFAVLDASAASQNSYWLYFLVTIATTMASVSMELPVAVVYTVGAPVLYGIIRITPAGGEVDLVRAVLVSVYSIFLGGAILILIAVLRYPATGVDRAQQNAVERYAHAVRQHATEAERVQVDAIVHDSVLTTLLSAARAFTPEAKALAATMAGNAIGHLREAVTAAPDADVTVRDTAVASRITDAADAMSHPFTITTEGTGGGTVPLAVAEAMYSAAVQAMVNSLQHAGPGVRRYVEIRFDDGHGLRIRIGDEGTGFDPGAVPTERLGVRVSILERVTSAGGKATIDTAPGEGTVVTLAWADSEREVVA